MDGLSFSRRKIWLACDRGALVSGFVNILVYLTNKRIILKPLDGFFLKKKLRFSRLAVVLYHLFIWPLGFKIIDNL